ncbi:MAG: hypothetical protein ABFR82_09475 [Nitrospirota bacterium]
MTKVIVSPGNCGFSVVITARKAEDKKIRISMDTECEMVTAMLEDIALIDMRTLFSKHFANPVYLSADRHLKHVACTVPCAILKAMEVELGLCVAEDVTIRFEKQNKG